VKDAVFYFKYVYDQSGIKLFLLLLGMVAVGLLDGIGILMILPMLGVAGIIDFQGQGIPYLSELQPIQQYAKAWAVPVILGIYIAIVAGHNVLQRFIAVWIVKTQQAIAVRKRLDLYKALLQSEWAFFLKKRRSDLLHSITTELGRISVAVNVILDMTSSLLFTLIQVGIALWLSAKVTGLVLVCGAILAVFSRRYIRRSKQLGGSSSELGKSYLAGLTDQLNGIKEIKSNGLEQSRLEWMESISREMNEEQLGYVKIKTSSQLVYRLSSAVLIAVFIMLFLNLFPAQPAQLILITVIFSRLWPRFTGFQSNLEKLASAIPPLLNILELEKECGLAKELQAFTGASSREPARIPIRKEIECRQVRFAYHQEQVKYALDNINIRIPAGSMTAIVGRSGAGKTTLIDLIMGLLKPNQGRIAVDGSPITNDNILEWRHSISYVPQDPFLFHMSIMENLLISNRHASEEQIWSALELSSAAQFVKRLPAGLHTVIGDRGIRLSGGERQRLVIARALLRQPSVLILDEATSALDTENEMHIQEAIHRIKGTMTIIVIAHRFSTIRHADQVIVLDKGKVIQAGGYNQLANEKKGLFRSLLGYQSNISNTTPLA
jgi:ABC-type multidrug transport system fused ATPase/permease subunit